MQRILNDTTIFNLWENLIETINLFTQDISNSYIDHFKHFKTNLSNQDINYQYIYECLNDLNNSVEEREDQLTKLNDLEQLTQQAIELMQHHKKTIEFDLKQLKKKRNKLNKKLNTFHIDFTMISTTSLTLSNTFQTLCKWTNYHKAQILFDSDIESSFGSFKYTILNKEHLYFISFDNKGNIFGNYINTCIDRIGSWIPDSNMFLFSLRNVNHTKTPIQYFPNKIGKKYGLFLYSSLIYYWFACGDDGLRIATPGSNDSKYYDLTREFINISNNSLTGTLPSEQFVVNRFIVVQMYDSNN
ncbi:TLDc domain-containing protein [Entamoeba marina]